MFSSGHGNKVSKEDRIQRLDSPEILSSNGLRGVRDCVYNGRVLGVRRTRGTGEYLSHFRDCATSILISFRDIILSYFHIKV